MGILDTGKIVSTILALPNIPHKLGSILSELRCPFQNLHVAGNDVYFTLRVFLLLAIRSYTDEMIDSRHQEVLIALKAITNVSIPRRSDCQTRNIKKKKRRLQKSRKHQSKSWDTEKQEQIRAERAARRAEKEGDEDKLERRDEGGGVPKDR